VTALRLLLVCSEYPPAPPGGIGIATRSHAQALAAAGHHVSVVGIGHQHAQWQDGPIAVTQLAAPNGLRAMPRAAAVAARWALAGWIAAAVRHDGIAVVECPDYRGEGAFLPDRLPRRVAIVTRLHGSATVLAATEGRRASGLNRWFEARQLRRSDAVIAPSRYIDNQTRRLLTVGPATSAIIPHAVEATAGIDTGPREPGMMLYVGRLSAQKGLAELIGLFSRVAELNPRATLHLVGRAMPAVPGGPDQLTRLLAGLDVGVRGRIFHHGELSRNAVAGLYRRASLFIHAGRLEAFGLATAEAMAAGCPVAVKPHGGNAELVTEGVEGVYISEDSGHMLAELLDNPERLARMGAAAQSRVAAELAPDRVLQQNINIYMKVAAQ
jgi:glycosyltransferase involved in cell wall biosynthesis